jgi:nitrite reductase (NO-forming)
MNCDGDEEAEVTGSSRWGVLGAVLGVVALLMALGSWIELGSAQAVDTGEWPVSRDIRPTLTAVDDLAAAPAEEVHVSYAPAVPPPADRGDQRVFDVEIESIEGVCPLDPANGVTTEMWGFRVAGDSEVVCGSPGPVIRGRVGDVVRITLTNLEGNTHPHNIDFHAVTGQGGGAADLTVNPGESATIQVRLLYPGAFMYHCAYGDVPVHIAHGMYGMFIVDPEEPLTAVDHEWAIMQSEWYVGEPGPDGEAPFDADALFAEEPRHVTFNGRTDALVGDNTLRMQVGERARIYFVNEGLNLDSNFHPIGSHWDAVYPEGATHQANHVIRGSQSTLVVAGGGTVVEVDALVPSTVILVDHALVRTFYKGAIGTIVIDGEADPELFDAAPGESTPAPPSTEAADVDVEVVIPEGAFDPANADQAYDPLTLAVDAGTTVRWTNDDTIAHTVTSGASDGTVGTADGLFDSGFINPGESFVYTFDDPGEFDYFCLPHPWMVGSVVVTDPG